MDNEVRPIPESADTENNSMNITTQWTFGNFDITAATQVDVETSDPKTLKLLSLGLLKALYGSPASAAEKAVAADGKLTGKVWAKNKKGEPERPKEFKRNYIPFSEETAMALAEAFGTTTTVDSVPITFAVTDVVEHVSDTGSAMKRATAIVDTLLGGNEDAQKQLRGLVTVLGMTNGATATREELITFAHSKGLGAK